MKLRPLSPSQVADLDNANGSLTMNEVTMYLKGKKYRRFVGWLLADHAKHWKEYDTNGSGTMEHAELSAAIGGFVEHVLLREEAERELERFSLVEHGTASLPDGGREADGAWKRVRTARGSKRWQLHSRGGTRIPAV